MRRERRKHRDWEAKRGGMCIEKMWVDTHMHTWWLLWGSAVAGTVFLAGRRSPSAGRAGSQLGCRLPCCPKHRTQPSSPENNQKARTPYIKSFFPLHVHLLRQGFGRAYTLFFNTTTLHSYGSSLYELLWRQPMWLQASFSYCHKTRLEDVILGSFYLM